MRRADAPRAGWYPDPAGGTALRWWDGLDWTDHRRPPPSSSEAQAVLDEAEHRLAAAHGAGAPARGTGAPPAGGYPPGIDEMRSRRQETAEVQAEVRAVAREEVDRAVRRVTEQARDATGRLDAVITQYGDRVMRWIRNIGIVAIVLFVLWMVLTTVGQTSLLNWLGDRIDNLFEGRAVGPTAFTTGPLGPLPFL